MNSALSPFLTMLKQYYCEYVHTHIVVKQLKKTFNVQEFPLLNTFAAILVMSLRLFFWQL